MTEFPQLRYQPRTPNPEARSSSVRTHPEPIMLSTPICVSTPQGSRCSVFLQEFLHQVRLLDTTGSYATWSQERLLCFLFEKCDTCVCPLVDVITRAFYEAAAATIARVTGKATNAIVASDRSPGTAMLFCGCLMVSFEIIDRVRPVYFSSIEAAIESGERLVNAALDVAQRYFDLPQFDSAY